MCAVVMVVCVCVEWGEAMLPSRNSPRASARQGFEAGNLLHGVRPPFGQALNARPNFGGRLRQLAALPHAKKQTLAAALARCGGQEAERSITSCAEDTL